jgi:hypothetical protein
MGVWGERDHRPRMLRPASMSSALQDRPLAEPNNSAGTDVFSDEACCILR